MSPPTPNEPITLKVSQTEAGAHALARAFQHDPLMIYALPNAQTRAHLLPVLFRIVVRCCLRYGVVYTTSGLEGVVCCLPPGHVATIGRLARISLSGVPVQLGLRGLRRYLRVSACSDQMHKQAAPGAHWYIWALGVDPAYQGRGCGGQLAQAVLWQARAQGTPCYLDTENLRNVPFYQQYGFRLVREAVVPDSGVRVYAMLWEPEGA